MIESIFNEIVYKCYKNNIQLILSPSKSVEISGIECSGLFTAPNLGNPGTFAVAIGKPFKDWVTVCLHELSHMDQYIEQCDVWKDGMLEDGRDCSDHLFDNLQGISTTLSKLELINRTIAIELDCEKRTVHKIYQHNLTTFVNVKDYIRKANSYVFFYRFMVEYGKFYDEPPYMIEDIWMTAPDHFDNDYSKIPNQLYKKYLLHYGN